MAYTIQFNKGGTEKRDKALAYLRERLAPKEGEVFRATFTAEERRNCPCIIVTKVRLVKAKPYCGNHPGECEVGPLARRKPKAKFLEWDDWVRFHGVVNRALNRFRADADVWSEPQDVRGKMWIRKGTKPRVKWGWDEQRVNLIGTTVRVWNQGTPDQF